MQVSKIAEIEKKLKQTNFGGQYQLEPFSFLIPGDDLLLNGYTCRPISGYSSYYYNEKFNKEKIVLHYTAGYLKSDIRALSQKNWHVSVAFVIARDGTIYQLHNSDLWSYHLGRGAVGGNANGSRSSIGIELCNYGFLVKRANDLETIYSRAYNKVTKRNNPVDVYCSLEDTDKYIKLNSPYRGQEYFASFTESQYVSLILLLRYLTATKDIPRKFLPSEERFDTTEKVVDFQGILSHVNFRKSGKWDIGPAFDWDRVIDGVQAEVYSPKSPNAFAVEKAEKELKKAEQAFRQAEQKLDQAKRELEKAKAKLHTELSDSDGVTGNKFVLERGTRGTGVFLSEKDVDVVYPSAKGNKFDEKTYGDYGPETDYDPNNFK